MAITKTRKISVSRGNAGICPQCNKAFGRSGDLQRHIQTHAPPEQRRWKCKLCPRRFVQKTALTTHMNIHTGAKPFSCNVGSCNAVFSDPSSRSRHCREAHSKHPGYKCPAVGCKSQIKRRSAFTKHLRTKHGIFVSELQIDGMLILDVKQEDLSDVDNFINTITIPRSPKTEPDALGPDPEPVVPTLIAFSPSRSSRPILVKYFNEFTPDLSSPGSSASPSTSRSIANSPSPVPTQGVWVNPIFSPNATSSDNFSKCHELMPTYADHKDYNSVEPDYTFQFADEPDLGVWDPSSSFFQSCAHEDMYTMDSDISPLSELPLSHLGMDSEYFAYRAGPTESASMQGLYYDTIPHALSTAWSQSS